MKITLEEVRANVTVAAVAFFSCTDQETKNKLIDFYTRQLWQKQNEYEKEKTPEKKSWQQETLENLIVLECPQRSEHGCKHGITIYEHTSGQFYRKAHCDNCGFTWDIK